MDSNGGLQSPNHPLDPSLGGGGQRILAPRAFDRGAWPLCPNHFLSRPAYV